MSKRDLMKHTTVDMTQQRDQDPSVDEFEEQRGKVTPSSLLRSHSDISISQNPKFSTSVKKEPNAVIREKKESIKKHV
jgi:hypothetical protein